jgi:hypothetical protein
MRITGFHHDYFGVMPAFYMLGLRDSLRAHCLGMLQNVVVHFVFIQTLDQSPWHFHKHLRSKAITFPCDLYCSQTRQPQLQGRFEGMIANNFAAEVEKRHEARIAARRRRRKA